MGGFWIRLLLIILLDLAERQNDLVQVSFDVCLLLKKMNKSILSYPLNSSNIKGYQGKKKVMLKQL